MTSMVRFWIRAGGELGGKLLEESKGKNSTRKEHYMQEYRVTLKEEKQQQTQLKLRKTLMS